MLTCGRAHGVLLAGTAEVARLGLPSASLARSFQHPTQAGQPAVRAKMQTCAGNLADGLHHLLDTRLP